MPSGKQLTTILVLSALVIAGVAGVNHSSSDFKNLQILPKDISMYHLDSIMESYNKALGVHCDFCHSKVKGFPDSLDFASDKEPMKENAREMMRMTIHVNKTWFYHDKKQKPEFLNTVHCMTCHRGEAYPAELPEIEKK
jgi:hypothetical protein